MTARTDRIDELLRQEIGAILAKDVQDPRIGFVRDSFVGMALVLDLLAAADRPLSALVDELPRWVMVKDKFPTRPDGPPLDALWERLMAASPDARTDRRDGLRLDWSDRWAHVRASNTEPIVRVITEAHDAATARALATQVGKQVTGP